MYSSAMSIPRYELRNDTRVDIRKRNREREREDLYTEYFVLVTSNFNQTNPSIDSQDRFFHYKCFEKVLLVARGGGVFNHGLLTQPRKTRSTKINSMGNPSLNLML